MHELFPDVSNFLEGISHLSHSVVFLYFFARMIKEDSYLSLLFSATLHSNGYIFPFLLCLKLLFFSQLFVRPPQTAILSFAFPLLVDSLDHCLLYNVKPPSTVHQGLCLSDLILESICHFHCIIVRDWLNVLPLYLFIPYLSETFSFWYYMHSYGHYKLSQWCLSFSNTGHLLNEIFFSHLFLLVGG